MAGNSFAFDPATNDLVPDGNGSYVKTPRADTHVQLQLQCVAGQCWQDPLIGSRLSQLSGSQPEVTVPDEIRRCLGVLQNDGRITNITAAAVSPKPGRVDASVTYVDTSDQQVVTQFFAGDE